MVVGEHQVAYICVCGVSKGDWGKNRKNILRNRGYKFSKMTPRHPQSDCSKQVIKKKNKQKKPNFKTTREKNTHYEERSKDKNYRFTLGIIHMKTGV